jgi:hypothetical protein
MEYYEVQEREYKEYLKQNPKICRCGNKFFPQFQNGMLVLKCYDCGKWVYA